MNCFFFAWILVFYVNLFSNWEKLSTTFIAADLYLKIIFLVSLNILAEADEEMVKKVQSRALSEDLAKEKPSEIMKNLESGFSLFSDVITEGYET